MARVALPESRLRARRKRRRTRLAIACGIVVFLLAGALAGASYLPFLQIREVVVSGAQTLEVDIVKEYAQGQLAGRYLLLFPKDNIFLYPKHAIAQGLLSKYPELRAADVGAVNFHTIGVEVAEREPKAKWCTGDVCYLMDQGGVVYGSAYGAEGFVAYRGKTQGSTLPMQYLTPERFEALFALVDALAHNPEAGAVVEAAVDHNNDVFVEFESGFVLKLALDDAGGDVFERFNLALRAQPLAGRPLREVEYLDLRFGDKLYYKLK